MQVQLPPELDALVRELVDAELFLDAEDAVIQAVWLLKDQYELYKVKREKLRAMIAVGIGQLERGEVAPFDIEAIKAKAAARLREQRARGAGECPP